MVGGFSGHAPDMRQGPSTTRKLGTVGITAAVLFGSSVILIGPAIDRPRLPAGTVEGYRIEHRGPMPDAWLAATRDSKCWDPKRAERGFTRATNEDRRRLGRSSLNLDPELSQAARKHTREMTSRNLLHHTSSDALRRRVTFWTLLGENVGVGNTVESLQKAFMDSPGHRDNILYGTFRHIGIGTRKAHGRLWVTVLFEARDNPGTSLRMPRC